MKDVVVNFDAKHLCVSSRGIKNDVYSTVTAFYGRRFGTSQNFTKLQNYINY